jgi:Antibiotic biosynthesis monooxygenase
MSPVVGISVITPKPGLFDEFMELQLAQLKRLRGKVAGLRGSRLYRSRDGRSAVMVALFETPEDQKRFAESAVLQEHLARVRPLVEPAGPILYETAYEVGEV